MPYKNVESLQIGEACIQRWLDELNPRTTLDYGLSFREYRSWFIEQGYWPSAQAVLEEYEGLTSQEHFRHVDVLKEYIRSKGTGTSSRRGIWYAVRSFYAFYRLPLPDIPQNEVSRLFKPSDADKRKALELAPLRLEDVGKLIRNAPQPYKAAIMVIFQGALGQTEFTQFNVQGWQRAVEKLDEPGPLRLNLFRKKTSRTRVDKYYTFVGADGKELIREWLEVRPQTAPDALFVVKNKNEGTWVPLRGILVGNMITKIARRAGLIAPNGLNLYHVHAHEFQDLFKSLCTLNGVNPVASEYFLGHSIDKLSYDKSPDYDEEWFRAEYLKVEPRLNLVTNPHGDSVAERIQIQVQDALAQRGLSEDALQRLDALLRDPDKLEKLALMMEKPQDAYTYQAIEASGG